MHCIISNRNGTFLERHAFRHSFSTPEVADRINVGVIKIFFHYVPRARARDRRKAQLAMATCSADAEGEVCSEWSLVCTRGKSRSVHDYKKKRGKQKEQTTKNC